MLERGGQWRDGNEMLRLMEAGKMSLTIEHRKPGHLGAMPPRKSAEQPPGSRVAFRDGGDKRVNASHRGAIEHLGQHAAGKP